MPWVLKPQTKASLNCKASPLGQSGALVQLLRDCLSYSKLCFLYLREDVIWVSNWSYSTCHHFGPSKNLCSILWASRLRLEWYIFCPSVKFVCGLWSESVSLKYIRFYSQQQNTPQNMTQCKDDYFANISYWEKLVGIGLIGHNV